ncbi:BRO1-like domain-containing protein [Blyttiomyces helicus]|uniref:BRO domain-containing protein 1 n=1 Tax=Blyttiomyces helicus TaxID=388810 RepID=A0A4P9WLG8_9FUNG|nr:BRO1-like domain-containing protein [Blyttiomyces helicus]|eukprot:RKO91970.1 BRO1-like domain-containing protein [Blyttiomyces helicus]
MSSTLQAPVLHPPSKTTDDVDFASSIRSYIQTVYQEDPDKYATEIATLHRLRQDARGAGKDVTGRDILYRYYGQIELLDLRFPIDEKHVKISFNWYDAFSKAPISQYSIAYEKACIIFNIGATCASIAALQNRFDAAGLKMAFNYFQAAAGMFTYINENFLHAPSVDLSRDSIKTLVEVMLAQAQECFIEKVVMEKKKGALVAKLSAQAAHMYNNALDGMLNDAIRSQFDKAWVELVRLKAKHFQAYALYHRSLHLESEGKYGENVASLTAAETIAKEANKLATSFSSSFSSFSTFSAPSSVSSSGQSASAAASLVEMTKTNLTLISDRKTAAVKDNDLIYHESIPNAETLPAVEKLNAVKAISFAEVCTNGQADIAKIVGPDIFTRLVPLSVHEASSCYSEEKAKILRAEQERVDTTNGELQAMLDSMDLMPTLDKLKRFGKGAAGLGADLGPPASVRQWSAAVRSEEDGGSGEATEQLLGAVDGLKGRVREMLDEVGLFLDKEQHECEGMRVKYAEKWTQEPSSKLTSQIRAGIRQHRDSFEKALSTDQALLSWLNESKPDIEILKRPIDEVESIFAERILEAGPASRKSKNVANLIDDVGGSENGLGVLEEQIVIEKLDGILTRLRALKKERTDVLEELKTRLHSDDISSLLLLNKNKETQIFQAELSKFKPLQGRLAANIQAHGQFLHDLSTEFSKLKDSSKTMRTIEARERRKAELVKEWQRSFDHWREAKDGLKKGVRFYSDLAELVASLQTAARDFDRRRADERADLAKQIEENNATALRDQLKRLSVGGDPASSPRSALRYSASPYAQQQPVASWSQQPPSPAQYGQGPPPRPYQQPTYGSQAPPPGAYQQPLQPQPQQQYQQYPPQQQQQQQQKPHPGQGQPQGGYGAPPPQQQQQQQQQRTYPQQQGQGQSWGLMD